MFNQACLTWSQPSGYPGVDLILFLPGEPLVDNVVIQKHDDILVVTINRPEVRNAVNGPTARALADAFRAFDADHLLRAPLLTGAGGPSSPGPLLKPAPTTRSNPFPHNVHTP